ncbi:hypothetical protein, partial [Paenibacillus sp.]|uniref:hypothetical protein n=1 Tax=Paenibacillus sp. TaxID=58172 RepID=UPI002D455A56
EKKVGKVYVKKITKEEREEKLKKMKFSKDITQEQIDLLSDAMIMELSKQDGEVVRISSRK